MNEIQELASAVASSASLEQLSPHAVEDLSREFPGIPADYVAVVTQVGWGQYPAGFMIYSSPIDPGNVFDDETAMRLKDVVLIGDDMQGISLGYSRGTAWRLVEIDSLGAKPEALEQSLIEYLMEWAV